MHILLCLVTGHQSVVPLSCMAAELQSVYKASSHTSSINDIKTIDYNL